MIMEPQRLPSPSNQSRQRTALHEARMQQLIENCQQEVLAHIIGPFGLTPAMFNDKDGGNVSTVHNAEKGIFSDEKHLKNYEIAHEDYNQKLRQKRWDDTSKRGEVHRKNNQAFDTGQEVLSDLTQKPMSKGAVHGDHTVSLKEAHGDKAMHLRFSEEERKNILNNSKNMAYIEGSLNSAKGEHSWEQCLSNPEFVKKQNLSEADIQRIRAKDKEARRFIKTEKNKRLAGELLSTGAQEASRNALRQAFGVLLHEFANGSFIELKSLLQDRHNQSNLIDRLTTSMRRVMRRVIQKFQAALEALVQGGVQGFLSNLLTFLINNLITTSKKIVAILRESMQSLWKAIKLMHNPPTGMTGLEITREVSKIIAAVVTTGLGMMLQESVKGFILSVPIFAPIADVLSTALTAIITGIAGAVVIYGIDRLFDWLNTSNTEILQASEANIEAQAQMVGQLQNWLQLQYDNSRMYEVCAIEYRRMEAQFTDIAFQMEATSMAANVSVSARNVMIDSFETQIERRQMLKIAFSRL